MTHRADRSTVLLVVLVLAGCGGSSSVVVHTATTPVQTTSSGPVTKTTGPASTAGSAGPTASVTPATGLADRQRVQVDASGFTPGEPLEVIECAQKGTKTGPGDCNLTGMTPTTADGVGRISVQLTVLRGPFGANNIVCGAKQPCLVSVTQASLTPSQEADVAIAFAAK